MLQKYGLLIDYEFCVGCYTCEVACKQEHGLPVGKCGIKVVKVGPMEIAAEKYQLAYIPIPTELCNLCEQRVKDGKLPACVHHCTAGVVKFGTIEALAEELKKKPKWFCGHRSKQNPSSLLTPRKGGE